MSPSFHSAHAASVAQEESNIVEKSFLPCFARGHDADGRDIAGRTNRSHLTRYPAVRLYSGRAQRCRASRSHTPLSGLVQYHQGRQLSRPINLSLKKVARFVNLLGAEKVRPAAGDIVVIIHGLATPLVLRGAPYAARMNVAANPNVALIVDLQNAGVSVRVCSQAMVGNKIRPDQVTSGAAINDSALTTLASLQLRGFALTPD